MTPKIGEPLHWRVIAAIKFNLEPLCLFPVTHMIKNCNIYNRDWSFGSPQSLYGAELVCCRVKPDLAVMSAKGRSQNGCIPAAMSP